MMSRYVHQIVIVIHKELKDSLRDRRALFSIAFSIVVGPVAGMAVHLLRRSLHSDLQPV